MQSECQVGKLGKINCLKPFENIEKCSEVNSLFGFKSWAKKSPFRIILKGLKNCAVSALGEIHSKILF
ncbi:MAG: hypothetical protein DWQ06_03395 [Calditrichaeota bacterium]|nr:MAG: hypothetical protein DWQ06_03395 [Calditrichota bacterium]